MSKSSSVFPSSDERRTRGSCLRPSVKANPVITEGNEEKNFPKYTKHFFNRGGFQMMLAGSFSKTSDVFLETLPLLLERVLEETGSVQPL